MLILVLAVTTFTQTQKHACKSSGRHYLYILRTVDLMEQELVPLLREHGRDLQRLLVAAEPHQPVHLQGQGYLVWFMLRSG